MKKKAKKSVKKTSKTAVKTKTLKIQKSSIIEEVKDMEPLPVETTTTIEKLPIELIHDGFDFLSYCFQPDGFEDENGHFTISDQFLAVWKTFLCIGGWTEDEYWKRIDEMPHEKCEKCQEEAKEKTIEKAKNIN